ncbi:hypothetical protein [Pinibacter aurantiacus]|uniref:DUF4398 domain-containing protein n=1 Tax=Pinibacter aurantiacus TaxID=2851599 RepID=A0A9E2W9R0_9BACT|nr:hypothetical protein [Pinibacter aurantiacus]MBV4360077.1 hypothetical protein [Pinibacter aurantiacus]
MKKQFFAILLCVAIATASRAQTTESTIKIDKTERSAISNEYNMSSDALKDALKESFKSKDIKLEKSKGLLLAKAVSIQEMGNNMYDVYFSVDPASRSEKDRSVLKMALSSGYDNFISPANADVYLAAKNYLASLSSSIYAEKKQVDISAQTESFTKAQRKYNDLVKESERLEKQRKNVEGDIAENKRTQDLQLKEMERQKAALDLLKSGGSR